MLNKICHVFARIAILAMVGALGSQGWAQNADGPKNQLSSDTALATDNAGTVGRPKAAGKSSKAVTETSYLIGARDVLQVQVWKEKELSGTVPVRPDGKISLPLLDDVQAAGRTAMQLSSDITDRLKKYVADPRVTVVVEQVNSRQIYVLGEVPHPGAFALMPHMTILQAIAKAGGLTPFAHRKKIHIKRSVDPRPERFNYDKAIKGRSPDLELDSGDTIIVP